MSECRQRDFAHQNFFDLCIHEKQRLRQALNPVSNLLLTKNQLCWVPTSLGETAPGWVILEFRSVLLSIMDTSLVMVADQVPLTGWGSMPLCLHPLMVLHQLYNHSLLNC